MSDDCADMDDTRPIACAACKVPTMPDDCVTTDDVYCRRCGLCSWCYLGLLSGEGHKSTRGFRFCNDCVSARQAKMFTHPIPLVPEGRLTTLAVWALERDVRERLEPETVRAEKLSERDGYSDHHDGSIPHPLEGMDRSRGEPLDQRIPLPAQEE